MKKKFVPLLNTFPEETIDRIDKGYMQSHFAHRTEFIRHIVDTGLDVWEKSQYEEDIAE